jgi:Lon protease-like protein
LAAAAAVEFGDEDEEGSRVEDVEERRDEVVEEAARRTSVRLEIEVVIRKVAQRAGY